MPEVWVEGEVSNVKAYPSGHIYFSLKDPTSQISAVCFRSSAQRLKFNLTDGLLVIGRGHPDVYAQSGRYQLILEAIEPKGQGALQLAFEQLKRKLAQEGLFDAQRKRPIPLLPQTVGIVTSPAGAAIHDMLRTLRVHRAGVKALLFPVPVQGEGAAGQIAAAIRYLGTRGDVDVIITGRGGGSYEDLWAFNEEVVARAIAASPVPIVTGIGHEVDFTIADFVADLRAATPTAAAQAVARGWDDVKRRLEENARGLVQAMETALAEREQQLAELVQSRAFEALLRRVGETRYRVELLAGRLRQHSRDFHHRLAFRLRALNDRAAQAAQKRMNTGTTSLTAAAARLDALSPLASLQRGYAICRTPDGTFVTRVASVTPGADVEVLVTDGALDCTVRTIRETKR